MSTEMVPMIESPQHELMVALDPEEVLSKAQRAASALKNVIAKKQKPVSFNGEQYLEFEDWQTVGQFYGYAVKTGEAVPVDIEGVKGAKAQAVLLGPGGVVLGGAESYCMRDEPNWRGKPWFQLASMAQTRAGSKALRNRLGWVVVLAGYKPTPNEEMEGVHETRPTPTAKPANGNGGTAPVLGVTDSRMVLWNQMLTLAGGQDAKARDMLQNVTSFEKDGRMVPGKRDPAALTEKWAAATLNRINRAAPKIVPAEAGPTPAPDEVQQMANGVFDPEATA